MACTPRTSTMPQPDPAAEPSAPAKPEPREVPVAVATRDTPAATEPAEVAEVAEPAEAPKPAAGLPQVALIVAADREKLTAAAEPTVHEQRVHDGIEATLVLRVGEASIPLTRNVWALDQCERFSQHFRVVDVAHGLVDARINCHFGEDFWTSDVHAELVVVDVAHEKARALWSGAETYTGAMGECTTADGEIAYEIEGDAVWQTRTSWADYEPQDPGDPLTPRAECVRPATPDTRSPVATLQRP